jgi:PmbA protein
MTRFRPAEPYNGLAQRALDRFYLNSPGTLRHEAHSYASTYLYSQSGQEGRKPRSTAATRIHCALPRLDISEGI